MKKIGEVMQGLAAMRTLLNMQREYDRGYDDGQAGRASLLGRVDDVQRATAYKAGFEDGRLGRPRKPMIEG